MQETEIQKLIEDKLPDSQVAVVDTRGSGDHFEIMVVSNDFEDVPLIDRHRMIHSALGENLGGEIHAVEIKAYTPEQWKSLS
ncbi:MAG: BolA family transcriptional regulator [Candidatus Marinimicrobia bacterium]|nr:BolA family transcriptional regulator [Candidatus Neomarinimicrobiota bacterium]MCH7619303.1 BolA family transcriptional regulator [Candidatus Neomarinimicrobiota bacterium]MCH8289233.1 BolA family transcriptional regulator [Candidatus Neomarinimicrobiota bacterium]